MATDETYRVVGYDPRYHGSAQWLTPDRELTPDLEEAQEFVSYIVAERAAAQLVADHYFGLLWMPVPSAVMELADVQSDRKKPWRERPPV